MTKHRDYSTSTHKHVIKTHQDSHAAMVDAGKKVMLLWHNLLSQLVPDTTNAQYVNADPGPEVDFLLEKGLLKPAKKPDHSRFVVPKTMAYATMVPIYPPSSDESGLPSTNESGINIETTPVGQPRTSVVPFPEGYEVTIKRSDGILPTHMEILTVLKIATEMHDRKIV